jgi:opacity protein-like surface antigen
LAFRIQYGFSHALSQISNKNNGNQDPKWPNSTNTWQELLARLEYQLHKNIAVQLGYYFNKFNSKDFGVDIMELWMGDYDNNSGILRSVFLGDRFKGDYTAHVALLGLKVKF